WSSDVCSSDLVARLRQAPDQVRELLRSFILAQRIQDIRGRAVDQNPSDFFVTSGRSMACQGLSDRWAATFLGHRSPQLGARRPVRNQQLQRSGLKLLSPEHLDQMFCRECVIQQNLPRSVPVL